MTVLMIVGDTHGNMPHVERVCRWARRHSVDKIVQVGDFGFVWQTDERLIALNNVLNQFKIPLYWLDGNHENFDLMANLGARTDAEEMVKLTEWITYLPRGLAWDWDGVRFMSLGGAYSVDKYSRTPGRSWWPQEMIKHDDIERACANGPVDVLLTHDAPELPPKLEHFMLVNGYIYDIYESDEGYKTDSSSKSNRVSVTAVMQAVNPKLLVHGHFHHRYNDVLGETVVVGLDRDTTGNKSYVIIDTDNLQQHIDEVKESVSGQQSV